MFRGGYSENTHFLMTMMTSRWVVRTYRFSDKWWLILSSTTGLFILFLNGSKWKKMFPFCLKKTTTSFFTCLTRFFFFQKKQVCLLLGFKQRKKQATFFICFFFFFCFPSDDNWWQVGRWYGIPNLVMTWWLGWVVVTKWSKCWWRHIEMVP